MTTAEVFPSKQTTSQGSDASARSLSTARKRLKAPCAGSKRAELVSRKNCELRKRMVSFLPLVKRVAYEIHRNLPPHVEEEELIGNGVMGLIDAAAKFEPAKRVSFEVYARHRIRGAILDALRREDRASRSLRRKIRRAESAGHALEARLGRPVTDQEMALELGMDLEDWYRMAAAAHIAALAPAPLDESLEGKPSLSETIAASGGEDPFTLCFRNEQKDILARALRCLEEREREAIRLYYFDSRTMNQIGAALGVDESRVSQIHSRAIRRLRECVQAMQRRGYVRNSAGRSA